MKQKPFKYYRKDYEGMIMFFCDTDFSIYDYKPDFTIYKRGWFRGHEDLIVLMITDVMKPQQERTTFKYFNEISEALEYLKPFLQNDIKENRNI